MPLVPGRRRKLRVPNRRALDSIRIHDDDGDIVECSAVGQKGREIYVACTENTSAPGNAGVLLNPLQARILAQKLKDMADFLEQTR